MTSDKKRLPIKITPKERVFDTVLAVRKKNILWSGILGLLFLFVSTTISMHKANLKHSFSMTSTVVVFQAEQKFKTLTAMPAATLPLPTSTAVPTSTPVFTSTPSPPDVGDSRINPINHAEMVFIPAGDFQMGGDADNAVSECLKFRSKCTRSWFTDEEPVHNVYVDAFWVDKTEVTNAMFVDFLNQNGNQREGDSTWLNEQGEYVLVFKNNSDWQFQNGYANHPVNYVSWYGAQAYCEWAGSRLPTEVEWEKVASWDAEKNVKRMYPWGNNFNCTKLNSSEGGNCDGFIMTSPVGNFPSGASFYGAYDMAGNVREWTADWYDIYAGSSARASSDDKSKRVIRGGSWFNYEDLSRTSFRYLDYPSTTYRNVGFRCATSE